MLWTFAEHLFDESFAVFGAISWEFDTHIDDFLINIERVF